MAALERAYDEVVHYLCGDVMPGDYLRESIAVAVLFTTDACPDDWEQMAKHAKVKGTGCAAGPCVSCPREENAA